MNKIFLLFCLALLTTRLLAQQTFYQMELNQNWKFHQAGTSKWLEATVPGTVHTDLLKAGVIQDPYYRTNERDQQWIDKVNWEYQTEFEVSADILKMDHIELDFKGLDTYADVFLNEKKIISADNMFRTWKVDCKSGLKEGKNNLRVYFTSPIQIGLKKLEAHKYSLPATNDQSVNGQIGNNQVSVFTRKAGYHYGWDWGPRFVTSGIWRPAYLIGWNNAKIQDVYIKQNEVSAKNAKLEAAYEVNIEKAGKYSLVVSVNDKQVASKEVDLQKGLQNASASFEIKNPKLWWSNGLGEAYLYTIKTSLYSGSQLIDQKVIKTGVRSIELVRTPDADGKGESFYFRLNGVPVFAKGANYIPSDVFLPRISNEEYERIVKLAVDGNMNMLRIWGGGIYENDVFYDLCDKYGILVWQDFMFACSMYPGDEAFMQNIAAEAVDNVKRLRNHASIALWCGNNEIETAWAEYDEKSGWGWKQNYTTEQRKEIWTAYDRIFHKILPKTIAENVVKGNYWHSSPSAGMGELATNTTTKGDIHYWGVWHALHPFEDYKKYIGRFMSEYGFQSFPEFETVKKYTKPEDWDITSDVMASHQRSGIGNLRIKEYMKSWYRDPKDFQSFLYVSHVLQAEALKVAFEGHRMKMPYCMGSLYWQINDCWPVASWSSTDFYRRWKALHYFVRKAYEPVHLAFETDETNLKVFVISDKLQTINAKLELKVIDFTGKESWTKEIAVKIQPNTSKTYFEVPLNTLIGANDKKKIVVSGIISADNQLICDNSYFFLTPKFLDLPKAEVEKTVSKTANGYSITLKSKTLAKNVFLSIADVEGFFADNYFDLLPNQSKIIEFKTAKEVADFEKKLQILTITDTF
jgi:beta-mannosidase